MMDRLGKAIILNSSIKVETNKVQPQLVLSNDINSGKVIYIIKPYVAPDAIPSTKIPPLKYIARQRRPYEFSSNHIVDRIRNEGPVDNVTMKQVGMPDIKIISNPLSCNVPPINMKEYMQNKNEGNLQTLCRVCACESEVTSPLFKDDGPNVPVIEKIHQYLPIKILPDDDLPQQVCDTCIQKLELCHNFITSSAEADAKLRAQAISSKRICKAQKLSQAIDTIGSIKIVDVQSNADGVKELPTIDEAPDTSEMEINLMDPSSPTEQDTEISSLPADPQEPAEISGDFKHPMTELICKCCSKKFDNNFLRIRHENEQKNQKKYLTCFVCKQVFPKRGALQIHLKEKHDETLVFPCDICGKTYAQLSTLHIHRSTHSKELPCLCDTCGKRFRHMSNLRKHKRVHMDETKRKPFRCDQCPKAYDSRFHLGEHMNTHTGEKPYLCGECGMDFHQSLQLRQHLLSHTEEKPHACPECGVRFKRKSNMTAHLKLHTQEKAFSCTICRSPFPSMFLLLAHRKTHTKEEIEKQVREANQPFKCNICYSKFTRSEVYEKHMERHAEETDFECTICNKKMKNKRMLGHHRRKYHTREKLLFSCNHCGESFASKRTCAAHERIHTEEKSPDCELGSMAWKEEPEVPASEPRRTQRISSPGSRASTHRKTLESRLRSLGAWKEPPVPSTEPRRVERTSVRQLLY